MFDISLCQKINKSESNVDTRLSTIYKTFFEKNVENFAEFI
jgi:hypothetical protein